MIEVKYLGEAKVEIKYYHYVLSKLLADRCKFKLSIKIY